MTIISISSRNSEKIQELYQTNNESNEKSYIEKADSCRIEIPLHLETIKPEIKEKKNVDRRRSGNKEKNEPGGFCHKDSKKCLVF